MDEAAGSSGTLGMETGTIGPGSQTSMETTASAGEDFLSGPRRVDLSFLAPSNRNGSLGRIGEYEIYGVLGRGAMGVVLRGYDRALNRVVAVKVQDPSLAVNRRARARFLKEARAVAGINHSNVVTIYKVNVVQERPYLAMEYVSGTLRERIKAGETFEVEQVIRIAHQVAQGLAAAHAQGVLHRDIKPANILLEGTERAKISDFGLALAGSGVEVAAMPDRVAGTPAYMSPEQVRNERMDARSDLFSLGCVIYAMLDGGSPFARGSTSETIEAVCRFDPAPPSAGGHPLACRLSELVMRLLAKDPEARPKATDEVVGALRALIAEADFSASTLNEAESTPSGAPERAAPVEPVHSPGLWPALTMAALGVAILACGIAWYGPRLLTLILTPVPRTLDPPPAPPLAWKVGRSAGADFADLPEALGRARPGTTLTLIDAAPYDGAIVLDDPERFRDLTIEGVPGASLSASSGGTIVAIRDVPGVVLKNLGFATRDSQFAVEITGPAAGVTLEHLDVRSPYNSPWTQVFIHKGASGSADRPIAIRHCNFEVGQGGVTIQADDERPVCFVEVRNSQFSGNDEYVHVLQAVQDIAIVGNRFIGGQPLTLNLKRWGARRVLVANNTFLRAETWLHPAESDPDQEAVLICNNAILESDEIDPANQDLSRMARGKWVFRNNLWEPGPEAIKPEANALAECHRRIDLLSRDPVHPDFLLPSPGSKLADSGCGGEHPKYVGARAPAVE